MIRSVQYRFTTVLLALLSAALVVFGVINFQQRGHYQLPDDDVSWIDSPLGVTAWSVAPDGPGDRAGICPNDKLEAINGIPIRRAMDAGRAIFRSGVWSKAT